MTSFKMTLEENIKKKLDNNEFEKLFIDLLGWDSPEGFQRSEFLLKHGMIDLIIERPDMKEKISGLITKLHHIG